MSVGEQEHGDCLAQCGWPGCEAPEAVIHQFCDVFVVRRYEWRCSCGTTGVEPTDIDARMAHRRHREHIERFGSRAR